MLIVRAGKADLARHGLDAAHAGGDGALREDAQRADLRGVVQMRAAAQLSARAVHIHNTHDVTVLLPEERRGAGGSGLVDGHFLHGDGVTVQDRVADDLIDAAQLLRAHGGEVREVEAQPVGLHERARLMHMVAQHLAQGRVQQVRRGVRAHDRAAAVNVDLRLGGLLDGHAARAHNAGVQELAGLVLLYIRDGERAGRGADLAVVRDLTAHLGIERRAVEHDDAGVALQKLGADLAVAHKREDRAGVLGVFIAGEGCRRGVKAEVDAGPGEIAQRLAGLSGADALLLHERVEAVLIDRHPLLGDHLLRQVEREAVGVIELEGVGPGEHALPRRLVALEQLREDLHAGVDRLAEVLLFVENDARDIRLLLAQLGVLALVFVHDHIHDLVQERLVPAEELAVARGAAQQTAQDIAASLVRGQHAVADHHDGRADVVGDDAQGDVHIVAVAVVRARETGDLVGDVHHGVHVKQRIHALTHDREALQTHARVDVLLHELGVVAVAVVVKLGEDVVPDLHIAVAVAARGASRLAAAVLLAAVIVDLGAGAAGTRAVLPEVVLLAETHDALGGDADLVAPDVERLVIVHIHAGVQAVGINLQPFGAREELPAPGDCLMLEVVAKGEVAEHLEIRAVAGGLADVFDVARTNALLAGADAVARRLLFALEVGLHRRHAGVDEQQRRIMLRDERKAREPQMLLRFKVAQELFAQLIQTIRFHVVVLLKKTKPRPRDRGEVKYTRGTTLIIRKPDILSHSITGMRRPGLPGCSELACARIRRGACTVPLSLRAVTTRLGSSKRLYLNILS